MWEKQVEVLIPGWASFEGADMSQGRSCVGGVYTVRERDEESYRPC